MLGFKRDPENSERLTNDADYDIIKLIEDEMGDSDELRTLAFTKICESKDMSEAIARWDNVTTAEIAIIVERGKNKEMSELLERSDADSIITDMSDKYIIVEYLVDCDNNTIKDEFVNRTDEQNFIDKVKQMAKGISAKTLTNKEKEAAVEDLSDEKLIKLKLYLTDIDDCSFDMDDVENEFSDRMSNNEDFNQKVKTLVTQIQ